jgi:hypothetical protein
MLRERFGRKWLETQMFYSDINFMDLADEYALF